VVTVLAVVTFARDGYGAGPPGFDKHSQPLAQAGLPEYCNAAHDVGRVRLALTNRGIIGASQYTADCLTGEWIKYNCDYPKKAGVEYLYGAGLWVGAIRLGDTLVSCGLSSGWEGYGEMNPDIAPFGKFTGRTIDDPDEEIAARAVSEQDILCSYTDTLVDLYNNYTFDFLDHRPHSPLHLKVEQSSYAWSYGYAEDIVLFNFRIKNIGDEPWEDMYLSLFVDSDIGVSGGGYDDLVGFRRTAPSQFGCGYEDTVNVAWTADNNGDPLKGVWVEPPRWNMMDYMEPVREGSARAAFGVRILEPPSTEMKLSYNWWAGSSWAGTDWGPRHHDDDRDIGLGYGTPMGDRNRYHVMSNHEFDFDQAYMKMVSHSDPLWQYPQQNLVDEIANGSDAKFLLSYGPFLRFEPGQSVSIAVAVVMGNTFHGFVANLRNLPDDPLSWSSKVFYDDLDKNALWAEWIYDNPGYDTDGDGYSGEFRVCVHESVLTDTGWAVNLADTNWYTGDGVPDWRGASPPPAPYLWIEPFDHGARIRFNGEISETTIDAFSQTIDFEGYRAYIGRDDRSHSMTLLASYDHPNYDKYVYNFNKAPKPGWELRQAPFTLQELRCRYGEYPDRCGDTTFDPLDYTPSTWFSPDNFPESLFYFVEHDYNRHEFGVNTEMRRVYPDARDPRGILAEDLDDDEYTSEGHLKFFEYEYIITGLLPSVPYWVNVTSFDCGSPNSGLEALETSKSRGAVKFYAPASDAIATGADKKIYVYPNPYRTDGDYRAGGYEGRTSISRPEFRTREVHFANLPPRCTISIFSLDGDHVQTLEHDAPDDPAGNNHSWDLITHNRQMVVTGLYYWIVESPDGKSQIGKLAIIK
jgi:hypothetical protein